MDRRAFLAHAAALMAGAPLLAAGALAEASGHEPARTGAAPLFRISLAQWSLHRTIRGGLLDPLDFPAAARTHYGLDAVEYVNQFYPGKASDRRYLAEWKRRADDAGVRSLLVMCDGAGALGDPDPAARAAAVESHLRWADAAAFLGCHSIRVNAESRGSAAEQMRLCADGLHHLCSRADAHGVDVLVENHGGLSSDGAWLAELIRRVDHPRAGTLPDFGNFRIRAEPETWYDRYRGVAELMPRARAVSAKSHQFDDQGLEIRTDYTRMLRIVLDAGYRGYIGIEYEGDGLTEEEGIRATLRLLERVREELAAEYG